MLITEILPTLVFILLSRRGSKAAEETPDVDEEYEKEMQIRTDNDDFKTRF